MTARAARRSLHLRRLPDPDERQIGGERRGETEERRVDRSMFTVGKEQVLGIHAENAADERRRHQQGSENRQDIELAIGLRAQI